VSEALATHGSVEVVHMDLLFPGWDGLAVAPSLVTDQVLTPISQGRQAAYRLWDWATDEWDGISEVAPSEFLIVEGCGCSVQPAGQYAAVSVFVDADRPLRMRRGITRDGEAYRPHWERWAEQETALFASDHTRERADLVLDTSSL
jgi:uridine kinase